MKLRAQALLSTGKINRDKGIVEGVAVITMGSAKGHGMLIDKETSESVLRAAKKYSSGVKVKFNPNTFNHGDGSIAGLLPVNSFRMDGEVLRADLHLEESYKDRDYVLNLIEKQGDTFGLSIDFDCTAENISGIDFARCTEIFAATIVDQPAANPNGFWSIEPEPKPKPKDTDLSMDKTELMGILTDALKPTNDAISGLKADQEKLRSEFTALSGATAPIDLSKVDKEEMAAAGADEKDPDETKMAKVRQYRTEANKPATLADVKRTVLGFVREVGGPAARASATAGGEGAREGTGATATKAFNAKIDEIQTSTRMNRSAAIAFVSRKFPELHKAHLQAIGVNPRAKQESAA